MPRGLPSRRERVRPAQGVPLTRRTRRLPRILAPTGISRRCTSCRNYEQQPLLTTCFAASRARRLCPARRVDPTGRQATADAAGRAAQRGCGSGRGDPVSASARTHGGRHAVSQAAVPRRRPQVMPGASDRPRGRPTRLAVIVRWCQAGAKRDPGCLHGWCLLLSAGWMVRSLQSSRYARWR